jgi:hypothetical protein
VGLALFGFTLVLVIDRIAHRIEHRRSSDEIAELQAS